MNTDLLEMTTSITSAFVSHNVVSVTDVPRLITSIYETLGQLVAPAKVEQAVVPQEPAVSVRRSITPDYIVCLEDGKKLKMLKRHLMTHYKMTPEQYRAKWNLPVDYPMTSPNYAEQRRGLALKIGLGRKGDTRKEPVTA